MELALVEVAPEPEVAIARSAASSSRSHAVNALDGRDRRVCRGGHPLAKRVVVHLHAISTAVAAQVGDAGHGLDRLLDVEGAHRPAAPGRQVGARGFQRGRNALHPAGGAGQPLRQRRELAAQQAEQAAAEEVAVADRAPRELVEILLVEAQRVDLRRAARGDRSPRPLVRPRRPPVAARASASQARRSAVPASVRSGQRWSCSWLPASVAWTG